METYQKKARELEKEMKRLKENQNSQETEVYHEEMHHIN